MKWFSSKINNHFLSIPFLCTCFLALVLCSCGASKNEHNISLENLRVNQVSNALSVSTEQPTFSWAISSDQANFEQSKYKVRLYSSRNSLNLGNSSFDSGWIESSQSSGVTLNNLSLEPDKLYYWNVQIMDSLGNMSKTSNSNFFTTQRKLNWPNGFIDGENNSRYSFLRNEFYVDEKGIDKCILYITAKTSGISKQYVYNAYLNGNFVGLGPIVKAQNSNIIYYNSYDVTDFIHDGQNVIGMQNLDNDGLSAQLCAYTNDGDCLVLTDTGDDAFDWKFLAGNLVFREKSATDIGTGYYSALSEDIDATIYPFGWNDLGYNDANWKDTLHFENDSMYKFSAYYSENVKRNYIQFTNVKKQANGDWLCDLGKEIIGGIKFVCKSIPSEQEIKLYFGEEIDENGNVQYVMNTTNRYEYNWKLKEGDQTLETTGMLGYRYVCISNLPTDDFQLFGVALYQCELESSSFESSDNSLNKMYDFFKYTSKVTNQDLYVDSQTRERAPYEGDTFIEQSTSYVFSDNYSLSRFSIEYLINNRTWPAEYPLLMIESVLQDYLYTGDISFARRCYSQLQSRLPLDSELDTSIMLYHAPVSTSSGFNRLLFDWPEIERDGYLYEETEYSTLWNSVIVGAFENMSKIATALGLDSDADSYHIRSLQIKSSLLRNLFNSNESIFYDGLRKDCSLINHSAQHSMVFALYYGVYDSLQTAKQMAEKILDDGVKVSIYASYFLFNGLSRVDCDDIALKLLESKGLRSYYNVMENLGATITPEAWDESLKENMTYSHTWGSGGSTAIMNGVFGIKPLSAGFSNFEIKIQTGNLLSASIKLPTIKGEIEVGYTKDNQTTILNLEIPENTHSILKIQTTDSSIAKIIVDGEKSNYSQIDGFISVKFSSGEHTVAF
jgi:hypothetical protein